MAKKLILESEFYSEYFSGLPADSIYLLSEEEAAGVWIEYIDEKANSFFRLPEDHWLLTTEQSFVAEWVKGYNEDNPVAVTDALSKQMTWKDDDTVLFCIDKSRMIEAKWYDFKRFWIHFIQCHDDAPVVINPSKKGCAILFRRTDIVKLKNCN